MKKGMVILICLMFIFSTGTVFADTKKILDDHETRIENLETENGDQQSQIDSNTSRIETLENAPSDGKHIWVYDANSQKLGILVSGVGPIGKRGVGIETVVIYIPSMGKFAQFLTETGALQPRYFHWPTIQDCSERPYVDLGPDWIFGLNRPSSEIYTAVGEVIVLSPIRWTFDWHHSDDLACAAVTNAGTMSVWDFRLVALEELPFSYPVATPFDYVYE